MMAKCGNCGESEESAREQKHNTSLYAIDAISTLGNMANRRLWIALIVSIILFVASNCAWLWYESQFSISETTTITQENLDGYNNYIGNDGDINNGKTDDY